MTIKKLFLLISILQFNHIALAADEVPTTPTTTALDSEQRQILDVSRLMVAGETDALKDMLIDSATAQGVGITKSYLEKFFPTVEVSFESEGGKKPTSGLLIVAPLSDEKDIFNTYFTQVSSIYQDNRTTLNLGLGYRKLSDDKTMLTGVNAFYDHEFPYNHGRTSLGFEARTSLWEVNANKYFAMTKWRTGRSGYEERALDGYDLEAGLPLPYMNWAMVFVKQFHWNAVTDGVDLKGQKASLRASVPTLPGLQIEAGRTFNSGSTYSNENFINISYNVTELFGKTSQPSQPWFSSQAYQLGSMESRRYEKVRRTNTIVKQINRGFSVVVSGS